MSRMRVLLKGMSHLAIVLVMLTIGACATINGPSLSESQKEALLKERATELWKAQAAGDRAKIYDLYDPFYRVRVKKGLFSDKTIPIKYYNPEVVAVDIKGNVATVQVKMEYETKGLMSRSGKKFDQPKKETITNETWLFMDGTWYRQYIDYISDATFADY